MERRVGHRLFEMDERGLLMLVKSKESTSPAYLRFTNKTSRPIDIWWRDFHGTQQHYAQLDADTFFDINSYITHPWEFTDAGTKERYVIHNKPVFRPPSNIGGMMYRTNWNITVGVRSLRHSALLALAQYVEDPRFVNTLGLPGVLSNELKRLISIIHCVDIEEEHSESTPRD